jgi:hypothetical protein
VVVIAAFVLLADAAIVAIPALAEVRTASSPTPAALVADDSAALVADASATPDTYTADAEATRPILEEGPTASPTPKPTPKPTPRDTVWNARIWLKAQIGATQYGCIYQIFQRESKWNPLLLNSKSGAYGIPQAMPGSKMAKFGSNWRYSPLTQVKWGLWYVNSRYGSACQAWAFWQAHGWY